MHMQGVKQNLLRQCLTITAYWQTLMFSWQDFVLTVHRKKIIESSYYIIKCLCGNIRTIQLNQCNLMWWYETTSLIKRIFTFLYVSLEWLKSIRYMIMESSLNLSRFNGQSMRFRINVRVHILLAQSVYTV